MMLNKGKLILATTVVIASGFSGQVYATDSCEVLLCMAGLVESGDVEDGCKSAVKKYFSILKFKHGRFSGSKTAKKRESWLNSCPGGDSDIVGNITNIYGGVKAFF